MNTFLEKVQQSLHVFWLFGMGPLFMWRKRYVKRQFRLNSSHWDGYNIPQIGKIITFLDPTCQKKYIKAVFLSFFS
jgi:hypothetical protein